jgi:uncharacterized membrane protein YukC
MKMEPEEFTLNRTDKLRDEIDKKLNTFDAKIDQKVSYTSFHWTLGIFISLVVTAIGTCYFLYFKSSEKQEMLGERILMLELKSKK